MNHIELFAGCGGLSIGLENCGFDLLLANELSPMAAETFSFNLLDEDLSYFAAKKKQPSKTLWINSAFSSDDIALRLRENPQALPSTHPRHCDLSDFDTMRGKLLVGSIIDLNAHLKENKKLSNRLRTEDVDLVSGGPPCQSFSMAGLRELKNSRNSLPMEFANFVEHVKPKVALLENVSGILRPFTIGNKQHYAWFEVARAFASKGYYPLCLHVNAKYVGAAQNRPRYIMLALRSDIFKKLFKNSMNNEHLLTCFKKIQRFFESERKGVSTKPFTDLSYYDIEKDEQIFETDLLQSLITNRHEDTWVSVKDAIDDLRENRRGNETGEYAHYLSSLFRFKLQDRSRVKNHDQRRNSEHVKQRFKLYQNISRADGKIKSDTVNYLKNPDSHVLRKATIKFLLNKTYLHANGTCEKFSSTQDLLKHLAELRTKKQTQRALIASKPAPAALSIPDDACHYHPSLLRTLTVREMARLQSFPDWFEFRSKVTTGGQMRKFEVPQYTQVGNAVPPLLANALGIVVKKILAQ